MNAIEKIVIKNVEVKVGDKVQVIFNRFPETEKNNVSVTGKVKGITEYKDKTYLGIQEHSASNWFTIGVCTNYIISIKKIKKGNKNV